MDGSYLEATSGQKFECDPVGNQGLGPGSMPRNVCFEWDFRRNAEAVLEEADCFRGNCMTWKQQEHKRHMRS